MLTPRKQSFVNAYAVLKNGTESARKAGYSLKTCASQASRLLKSVEVQEALKAINDAENARFEAKKAQLSKEGFVETALNCFNAEQQPSVKPRYLEMVGRSLGYLAQDDSKSTVNNLIINADSKTLTTGAKWDRLRALIDGQA